jgi:hypothetical protein
MAGNEFGLGVFAFGCMLLTHPERLSTGDTLMIDCSGDEYSVRGDYTFDRVPLFDYDMAGSSSASSTTTGPATFGARRRASCTSWCDSSIQQTRNLKRRWTVAACCV